MELRIPGRVWYDALDPQASGMEADIGLPQPRVQPKGLGRTFVYEDVTELQAYEVADYLHSRSLLLSSQSGLDPNERELYRIMDRTARIIQKDLGGWKPTAVKGPA